MRDSRAPPEAMEPRRVESEEVPVEYGNCDLVLPGGPQLAVAVEKDGERKAAEQKLEKFYEEGKVNEKYEKFLKDQVASAKEAETAAKEAYAAEQELVKVCPSPSKPTCSFPSIVTSACIRRLVHGKKISLRDFFLLCLVCIHVYHT